MKIQVTQEHIDKGKPHSPYYCPLALAIRPHFPNLKVTVGNPTYHIGEYCGKFTDRICALITNFDRYHKMEPSLLEIDYENQNHSETH